MNPILKYPGAKWRLADWIISHMPPHESYLEPYFGSGAVFFQKPPARIETINDLDGEIVNFFMVCRDRSDELAQAIYLTPWAREELALARHDSNCPVERARRFAVKCWFTFGSRVGSKSWRHTTGRKMDGGPDNPKLWGRVPDAVREAAERLKQAQIENRPALDVIRHFDGACTLIYVDPPYVMNTRTAHCRQYLHEMSDQDHAQLLHTLNACKSMVLLSGYDSEIYRDILRGWEVVETRTQAERGSARTECLWINPAAWDAVSGQTRLF